MLPVGQSVAHGAAATVECKSTGEKRTAQLVMHLEDRHHMGSKAPLRKKHGQRAVAGRCGCRGRRPARLSPLRPRSLVSFAIDQSRMRLRLVLWLRLSHLLPWHDEALRLVTKLIITHSIHRYQRTNTRQHANTYTQIHTHVHKRTRNAHSLSGVHIVGKSGQSAQSRP